MSPSSNQTETTPLAMGDVPDSRVKNIHPQGRIYVTDVTIDDGTRATVREPHQVIFNGKAYQFSSC